MESMSSDISPCKLKNKLAYGALDSNDFVSTEFRNPKIGKMDGCKNGILLEEEQVSWNSAFVRGGGDYCAFSNGDYESVGCPRSADSALWGNWENSGNIGSVRQPCDSCSLSNSDFEGPEADFDIEGSRLSSNWKDWEDSMDEYVRRKNLIDRTAVLLAVNDGMNTLQVEPENYKDTASYTEMYPDLTKGRTNEDNATFLLVDKIESMDPSDKGAHLTSLKDFQGSGKAGFRRQMEECNDRWQESPAKNRDDTGHIRVQAALGDLFMKTSTYCDSYQIAQGETETVLRSMERCSDEKIQGEPHYGLFLTLYYLGLQDLMSVAKVCKSLYAAVKNDPLLWQSIQVEHPLNKRLTDDALLKLAEMSRGHLLDLSLVQCLKITDDGLKQVLDISPKLTKLRLPGCRRLTADGIVTNVKAHRECSMPGLKQLRIHGLLGITREHIEKLNYLLDGGLQKKSQSVKPRFYNGRYCSLSTDDDSTIDIEVCPRCGDATRVYDCPNADCQNQADHTVRECRACTFCIARCCDCGRCIDGGEYEETFHFEMRCADCVRASEVPRMEIAWLREASKTKTANTYVSVF